MAANVTFVYSRDKAKKRIYDILQQRFKCLKMNKINSKKSTTFNPTFLPCKFKIQFLHFLTSTTTRFLTWFEF